MENDNLNKTTIESVAILLNRAKKEQLISILTVLKQDSIIKRIHEEGMPKFILMSPDYYKNLHTYFDHLLPVKESLVSPPGTFLFSWCDDFLMSEHTILMNSIP